VFAEDDRYLYGSSFITGVSNILRFDTDTGDLEAVSNVETGLFRPIPLADGSVLAFEYTGQGFVPSRIDPEPVDDVSAITFLGAEVAKRHPEVTEWNVVETLRDFDYAAAVTDRGKYRPYRELQFDSGYPVIDGYRDTIAPGVSLRFSDPAQLHSLSLTATYSFDHDLPSSEAPHFGIEYEALNWHASYWHNLSDFYDLFGPTERARKGDAWIVGYEKPLIYDDPRRLDFEAEAAWYTDLDTLPGNQNVPTMGFDEFAELDLGLHYSDVSKSIGAVDDEKGWRWDVVLSVNDSDLETVSSLRLGLDVGFALPWRHSSIWLYNSAGRTNGDSSNPLGNFYFGGFGNNYVDDGEIKRYREYYSLPGFEIDGFAASDFFKTLLEWNLPPWRFREVGKPGLFLSHVRTALFAGHILADPGELTERNVTSAGVQFDLAFTLAHRLPMTLSLGYAVGLQNGDRTGDEVMLSLKIL
jgi:hypothetical protein